MGRSSAVPPLHLVENRGILHITSSHTGCTSWMQNCGTHRWNTYLGCDNILVVTWSQVVVILIVHIQYHDRCVLVALLNLVWLRIVICCHRWLRSILFISSCSPVNSSFENHCRQLPNSGRTFVGNRELFCAILSDKNWGIPGCLNKNCFGFIF